MLASSSLSSMSCYSHNPFQALQDMFALKIKEVDNFLSESIYASVKELPLISQHIIQSGGKRIRPLLTLASASLCGYSGKDDVTLAACVELLHTATLLHDDVVDESPLRRGTPTAHTLWGNQRSILTGDFLFSKLFQVLVQHGNLTVLNLFSTISQTIIEGEMLQINARNNPTLTEAEYIQIIQSKTAVLFGLALELGTLLAANNITNAQKKALTDYANAIGIVFQITDDLLDYMADEPKLGKSIGNDFFEGQITLPLIYLLQAFDQESDERSKLNALLLGGTPTPDDFMWVKRQMRVHEIKSKIMDISLSYGKMAENALIDFPDTPLRTLFLSLPNYIINRCN